MGVKRSLRWLLVEATWALYGWFWRRRLMGVARFVWRGYWRAHCLWPETRYPHPELLPRSFWRGGKG